MSPEELARGRELIKAMGITPEQAKAILDRAGVDPLEMMRKVFGPASVVDTTADVSYLDEKLLKDGLVRVLPVAELRDVDPTHLRLWLHLNAVYLLPTTELVEWLRSRIGERSAIEVGAGNGALGRALGVPTTDSRMQERPEIKAHYETIGQPVIRYPDDVQKMNANAAVRRLRPQVVVASWTTHIYRKEEHERGGNMYGVDEVLLLGKVENYIHIGTTKIHGRKRILGLPHEEHRFDWLVSRGNPSERVIWVWK